jgi:hypothetical protein
VVALCALRGHRGHHPPLLYLQNFKKVLDLDRAGVAANDGTPDPTCARS